MGERAQRGEDSHGQEVTGARALSAMLDGYGVTHVFFVPAIMLRTLAELERRTSVKRVQAHTEAAAAYMADGYARVHRRPGVCMAQSVGAMNLAAGLRDAALANSPVLAFTGGRSNTTQYRVTYQDLDDMAAFEVVTKFNAHIDSAERFPDMVQPFCVATSGKPGPVHLRIAGNLGDIDADSAVMDLTVEPLFARTPLFRGSRY